MRSTLQFQSADGVTIHGYKWHKEGQEPKAILQVIHGSVEHVLRYEPFAAFLCEHGFVVVGNDHRGHGKSLVRPGAISYFSDQPHGWELAVADVYTLNQMIAAEYPNVPIFALGHSMGSFLLRDYISQYGQTVNGALISGTSGGQIGLVRAVLAFAKAQSLLGRRKIQSPLLHKMVYGTLNDKIENPRTESDFLSRDPKEVDKYIADPLCNATITPDYGAQMLHGILKVDKENCFRQTPNELPIFLFSGSDDPVGGKNGKDVAKVARRYVGAGCADVHLKIYEEARHELLNERNRDEVFHDLLQWMEEKI